MRLSYHAYFSSSVLKFLYAFYTNKETGIVLHISTAPITEGFKQMHNRRRLAMPFLYSVAIETDNQLIPDEATQFLNEVYLF